MRKFLLTLLAVHAAAFTLFTGALAQPIFNSDKADKYEENHTTWVYPPWEHTWGVVRATQTHLTFFTLGAAHFINPQGLAAVKLDATDDPEKRGDDDEVTVYGINSGENAIIYNRSMRSLGLYGYEDEGEGNLNEPWDVAADPNGLVFVTDAGNRRVVKFHNVKGDLVFEKGFGSEEPASLVLPRGVAVTGSGKVIVADAGSDRVVFFDSSGVFLYQLEGFDNPVGLAAVDRRTRWTRPRAEYIVISEQQGRVIRKLGFYGHTLAEVDVAEATGLENPYVGHVETDIYHNIIATDSSNACLLKFNSNLELISVWGQKGKGRSRFTGPTGIAIWQRFGQTFIAEQSGAHYLWVGIDLIGPPSLEVDAAKQVVYLKLEPTDRCQLELELLDQQGDLVRLNRWNSIRPGRTVGWPLNMNRITGSDGERDSLITEDSLLPGGDYPLRVRLRATYSSTRSFEKVIETTIHLDEPEVAVESSNSKTTVH